MHAVAERTETAIFQSGHEAMRFAYQYSAQQYPMTIMGRMMRGASIGSGRGLHGLDGAAVAGSVKRVVESLPPHYRDVLVSRYSDTPSERDPAIGRLLPAAIASCGTGVHHSRMVLKLICRYFKLHPVKLAELCDEYDIDAVTITRRWHRISDRIREMESHAMAAADEAMVRAGLVG